MPVTLKQIRSQYPEYKDLSDNELADKLYSKHYSDMPRSEFNKKVGSMLSVKPYGKATPGEMGIPEALGKGVTALGAGAMQTTYNIPEAIANLLGAKEGRFHTPAKEMFTPKGFEQTEKAGELLPYLVPIGEIGAGKAALGTAERYAPKMMEKIPGLVKSIAEKGLTGAATGGAIGAVSRPQDPIAGAKVGAMAGTALGELPLAGTEVKKAFGKLSSKKAAKDLMGHLSDNLSRTENAESLASDINRNYEKVSLEEDKKYGRIYNRVGDNPMYERGNIPRVGKSNYKELSDKIKSDIKEVGDEIFDNFDENPSFKNTHELKQMIGDHASGLESKRRKSGLNPAERNLKTRLDKAYWAFSNDLNNFLDTVHPDLKGEYQKATEFHKEKVRPYRNNKIIDISEGGKKSPLKIHNIFEDPEEDFLRISSDLGKEGKRKILFSKMSSSAAEKTPKNILKTLKKAQEGEYKEYFYPELSKRLKHLSNVKKIEDVTKIGTGLLAGAGAGSQFGPTGAAIGTTVGSLLGHKILSSLSPYGKLEPLYKLGEKGLEKGYGPLTKALESIFVKAQKTKRKQEEK